MYRRDIDFLKDILEACKRIELYLEKLSYDQFVENLEKQDAVIR